jgi:hypothetical protein
MSPFEVTLPPRGALWHEARNALNARTGKTKVDLMGGNTTNISRTAL